MHFSSVDPGAHPSCAPAPRRAAGPGRPRRRQQVEVRPGLPGPRAAVPSSPTAKDALRDRPPPLPPPAGQAGGRGAPAGAGGGGGRARPPTSPTWSQVGPPHLSGGRAERAGPGLGFGGCSAGRWAAQSRRRGTRESFSLLPCQRRGPCAVVTRSRPPTPDRSGGRPRGEGGCAGWGSIGLGALGQKAAPAPSPRPGLHVGSPAPQLPRAAPRPAPRPAPPAPACSPRGAPVRPSVVRPLAAEEAGTFARSLPLGWLPPGRRPGPRGYIGRRLQSRPDTSDHGRPARRPTPRPRPPAAPTAPNSPGAREPFTGGWGVSGSWEISLHLHKAKAGGTAALALRSPIPPPHPKKKQDTSRYNTKEINCWPQPSTTSNSWTSWPNKRALTYPMPPKFGAQISTGALACGSAPCVLPVYKISLLYSLATSLIPLKIVDPFFKDSTPTAVPPASQPKQTRGAEQSPCPQGASTLVGENGLQTSQVCIPCVICDKGLGFLLFFFFFIRVQA